MIKNYFTATFLCLVSHFCTTSQQHSNDQAEQANSTSKYLDDEDLKEIVYITGCS